MKKVKALLYCTKAKPYLKRYWFNGDNGCGYNYETSFCVNEGWEEEINLNGTIVAECEIEVEEIFCISLSNGVGFDFYYYTDTITDVREKSCLDEWQLQSYLGAGIVGEKVGYALHISNLKVFDKPKELGDYYCGIPKKMNNLNGECYVNVSIDKAPQNMMYAIDDEDNEYILISIQPQELCRILNGEQTILINKRVLNCMKE